MGIGGKKARPCHPHQRVTQVEHPPERNTCIEWVEVLVWVQLKKLPDIVPGLFDV